MYSLFFLKNEIDPPFSAMNEYVTNRFTPYTHRRYGSLSKCSVVTDTVYRRICQRWKLSQSSKCVGKC